MKVEILHVRDPDGACDISVFIDDIEVPWGDFGVVDVDAGRGYGVEDWEESIAWTESMPESPFRTAALAAYNNPPGGKYIAGWEERSG